jgi:AraC-like DNA-binding protein
MASRLDNIADWESLARECHYSTPKLAQACHVSVRQLQRFFGASFHAPLAAWLRQLRLQDAAVRLRRGYRVKEVAALMGFKHRPNFSAAFHRQFGFFPSRFYSEKWIP